ncbi:secreted protein containing CHASE4 domain protein, partial [Candidatus Magnetoovum chiemensis]
MSLRSKTAVILTIVMLLYAAFAYLILQHVIMPNFISLEQKEAVRNINRALEAMQNEIRHLDAGLRDWSSWDDTYNFIEDKNQEYINANLPDASFEAFDANIMYFYNTRKLVWGR